jgi:protein-tyrosine phosphatase
MIEVYPNLYVGSQDDIAEGFYLVQCAKYPFHRNAVGYAKQCAKDHPEYLVAYRPTRIILNMVDAPAEFFSMRLIQPALDAIKQALKCGVKVLVHCNRGESRGPGVAMLAMRNSLPDDYDEAKAKFKQLYPPLNMAAGIDQFLAEVWNEQVR